jgi:sorbitol-6-phosphate 2-dehydrogenase
VLTDNRGGILISNSWLGLEERVAIVTGETSGNGLQITNELLNNETKVVVADLNGEDSEQKNGTYFIQCDVTNKESVDNGVAKTVEKFGAVDILVNNVGVNLPKVSVDR